MKALVTGASSGIGRDMARELSKKGYDLVLVSRDEDKLKKLKEELEENKTEIEVIAMDLSVEENCKELHKKVDNIDILKKEISMIKTNVIAYHILTKLYLIDMKARNSGKILNVASIAGFMPGPLMSTYYATKGYVVRLSEGIREELKKEKSNVRISILCPGPVNTNFNNVANVKFHMREANSENVAKYAIRKMERGKFYIVPGLDVKLAKIGAKIFPAPFISKITYMIQKRKLTKK